MVLPPGGHDQPAGGKISLNGAIFRLISINLSLSLRCMLRSVRPFAELI